MLVGSVFNGLGGTLGQAHRLFELRNTGSAEVRLKDYVTCSPVSTPGATNASRCNNLSSIDFAIDSFCCWALTCGFVLLEV